MMWRVKRCLTGRKLYDEAGRPQAYIQKRGGCQIIYGMDRTLKLKKTAPTVYTICGLDMEASASITGIEERTALLPGRVSETSLRMEDSVYSLRQDGKRKFSVWRKGHLLGTLTDLLAATAVLSLPDEFSASQAALLYALAWRMIWEEEADVV